MFNRMIVHTALKRTCGLEKNPGFMPYNGSDYQSSVISQLIFDIFGGEILKTHNKKGWHYYNRINGERLDFTKSEPDDSPQDRFEDIPANTDEVNDYFEQEQYSTFFMRFIREFEDTVGLKKYSPLTS